MSLQCDKCNKEFSSNYSLNRHISTSRTCSDNISTNYVCSYCSHSFARADLLKKHNIICYKKDEYNLRNDYNKLKTDIDLSTEKLKKSKKKINKLTQSNETKQSTIIELRNQLQNFERINNELQTKLNVAEFQLESLKQNNSELQSKLSYANCELVTLKNSQKQNLPTPSTTPSTTLPSKKLSGIDTTNIQNLNDNFIRSQLHLYTEEEFMKGDVGITEFISQLISSGNYKCVDASRNKFVRFDGTWIEDNGGKYIYNILKILFEKATIIHDIIYNKFEKEKEKCFIKVQHRICDATRQSRLNSKKKQMDDDDPNYISFLENIESCRNPNKRTKLEDDFFFTEEELYTYNKVCNDDEKYDKLVENYCDKIYPIFRSLNITKIPAQENTYQHKLHCFIVNYLKQ